MGKQWKQWVTLFSRAPKSLQMVTAAMKLRHLLLGRKPMTNLDSILLKSRDITLPADILLGKAIVFFFGSYVWIWELNHKESWVSNNWCFWTVVLEKTLESLLDCKVIKPVNPKWNQCWILVGRTDAEAPVLWPSEAKSWLMWKDPDAGKDSRQEENGTTEDEMVGWHHWLSVHELQRVRHDWVTEL